ncbi:MAG TPA: hypothetical protein ENI08_00555 [Candidatus Dependentiae bacterium]|nr:hypothetical protein [Candidatus Dependentiae bacterium]
MQTKQLILILYLSFFLFGYSYTIQLSNLEQQLYNTQQQFHEVAQQLSNVQQQLHSVQQQLHHAQQQLFCITEQLFNLDQQMPEEEQSLYDEQLSDEGLLVYDDQEQAFEEQELYPGSAVTYVLRKTSRFGDYIALYSAAKFLSEKYGIQLLYKRFPFSHLLAMDLHEKKYDKGLLNQFKKVFPIRSEKDFIKQANPKQPLLYNICRVGFDFEAVFAYAETNAVFCNRLRKMIAPIKPLDEFWLPQDRITVAVHVRKGGGYDRPLSSVQQFDGHLNLVEYTQTVVNCKLYYAYIDQKFPLKFPPDQYYVDQIKKLSAMLNDAPLYVYLFTDDSNPIAILEEYEWIIGKPNIVFNCRKEENRHDLNVIEDFFAMTKFDCLIRPQSNFSKGVQLIGKHKIVIHPKKAAWVNGKLIINMVNIVICQEDGTIVKASVPVNSGI